MSGTEDRLQSTFEGELPQDMTESMNLVVAAQAGDELALNDLLDRYQARIRPIARTSSWRTRSREIPSVWPTSWRVSGARLRWRRSMM